MEAITIPHVRIPSINIGGICLPGIGTPGSVGKKGLVWPAGMKEHIKAIYDPKKQGMTNFDVIESYITDFATWTDPGNRGEFTKTNTTIHITKCKIDSRFPVTYKKVTGIDSITIKVQGVTTNRLRCINNKDQFIIDKDGVYTVAIHDGEFGFGFDNLGDVDVTITQLPTSILKDLSGNGNHAYLYGGKGKLNSGMGVYQQDFSNVRGVTTVSANGFELFREGTGGTYLARISIGYWNNKECKLLFETNNTSTLYYIRYRKANNDIVTSVRLHNGENIIPAQDDLTDVSEVIFEGTLRDNEYIRVTEIPDYPDQLCYDGKMYAVCYGFPILTDYTVMAERTWFENNGNRVFITKGNIWPDCAFVFEKINASLDSETFSFSKSTRIDDLRSKSGVTYQTKQSYNGVPIAVGDSSDGDVLLIGGQKSGEYIGCHGKIIVADRSFTEEEINWLKNNLFAIDIPTPAYDFDFSKYKDGSNLGDSITDKYGNVLELHNFAWKGMSGLGGYGIDINESLIQNNRFDYTYNNANKEFVLKKAIDNGTYLFFIKTDIVQSTQKIKFANINKPITFVNSATNEEYYTIIKDGIYDIDFITDAGTIIKLNYSRNEELNLKIQFLPNYPSALVFDGIDDYAKLAKMTIKTVIIDFVNLELDKQVYDNRDKPNNHNYFSIYPQADTVAYEARNSNGKTYINGELNTTIKTNDLLGVRCITCASNDLAKETEQYICKDSYLNNYYGKIALYRITGFTEMLTADQVWKWYQKNKPKGGDK